MYEKKLLWLFTNDKDISKQKSHDKHLNSGTCASRFIMFMVLLSVGQFGPTDW